MTKNEKKILVGAHMSASGGVHNALLEGEEYGANIIQLFTSNQRQWKGACLTEEEISLFEEAKKKTKISHIMSHGSYLMNLGSPNEETHKKSLVAFSEELTRCHQLKIDYLTFHPGAATGSTMDECIEKIAKSLLSLEKEITDGFPTLLLMETTAGQGSTVGYLFSQLQSIRELVKEKIPLGICLDTCHSFAAGYDIRTKEGWEKTLAEFDRTIGLENLKAFHVNDSLNTIGSRKDRHAPLGQGEIGLDCFRYLMTDPKVCYLPKYLETPFGEKNWKNEIKMLFEFAKQSERI